MKAHKEDVIGVAVQAVNQEGLLIVSISADDCINVWRTTESSDAEQQIRQGSWKLQQSISMPQRLQQAVAITPLPEQPGW